MGLSRSSSTSSGEWDPGDVLGDFFSSGPSPSIKLPSETTTAVRLYFLPQHTHSSHTSTHTEIYVYTHTHTHTQTHHLGERNFHWRLQYWYY
jgi:hypothetical protein